jgi:hypothetical protein
MENLDCSDEKHFVCVCNKYDREQENHLSKLTGQCSVRVRIGADPAMQNMSARELGNAQGIETLSLLFI